MIMKDILNFVKDMAKVSRWSQAHCQKEESTLEHTAAVAFIALKIGTTISMEVNVAELLTRALVHDMEESITGDIMTPIKYNNPELTAELKKMEKTAAKQVSSIFGEWAFDYWVASKDDSIEGQIIRIADKACSVYKIKLESSLGNDGFKHYEENVWQALYEIKLSTTYKELIPIIHEIMDYLLEKENDVT